MSILLYIFLIINLVNGFNKIIVPRKYSIKNNLIFKSKLEKGNKFNKIYCKENENIEVYSETFEDQKREIKNKMDKYQEIENMCNAEYTCKNDLIELEKIEKEMLDVYQKMRKHNTKRVYKKMTDLYKLFKK